MSSFWTGDRIARVPRYVFVVVAGIAVVVFTVAAFAIGFQNAWEVLTATKSPFGHDRGLGFALSGVGYVFVPTVIGLIVADWITRFQRKRLTTVPEAREAIGEFVKEAKAQIAQEQARLNQQEQADAGPKQPGAGA
jgi:hypothetical protein